MPYFVHPKGTDHGASGCNFTNRAQAHAYATDLTLRDNAAWVVSFHVSIEERSDWHSREDSRFEDGSYLLVPWNYDAQRKYDSHFVHLSTVHPGMVAYTPSDEHGVQDRQVRLKPGKYLAEFYETPGHLTHQEVQSYVTQCQIVLDNQSLSIATTAEDIVRVYEGQAPAPLSCMVKAQGHLRGFPSTVHPVQVYGDSDLAVAYYGPMDTVEARAIVWPAKHRYSRVYGTRSGGHVGTNGERLKRLLSDAGYSAGSIHGAKIRHIDYKNSYLMPYIDNVDYAEDCGNGWLKLGGYGDIGTSETCGYATGDNTDMTECQDCGREYDANDGDCEYCDEHRWTCEHCDGTQFGEVFNVDSQSWCESCHDEALQTCADDNCSHTWIEIDVFTTEQTTARTVHETVDLCESCAAKYTWCDSCEVSYDSQVCPDCERSPRCERTADLLTIRQSDTYMLEVLDPELRSGWHGCCFYTHGHGNGTDVGSMSRMIELREHAQSGHPTAQYRIVPFEVTANVPSL